MRNVLQRVTSAMVPMSLVTAGLLASAVWFSACTQQGGNPSENQQAYEILKVGKGDRELKQAYSAAIRGRQDVAVMPQVGGTIQRTCVTEGQQVTRGQLLFVIDQVPFQAAVRTARANVQAAQAGVATARLDYESKQQLRNEEVVSDFTLQTAHNAYLTAQAALAQAQAALVNAQNSLSYTEVKAPSAGVVGQLPFRTGSLVSPQMPEPLTTVSDNSQMWVYFSLTEEQLLALSRGHHTMDEAAQSLPEVELQLKDGSIYGKKGHVVSISGVVDRQTGTVSCRAEFDNQEGLLHSGQSGVVLIPSTYKDVIVIPMSAAVHRQDKYLVYKVVDGKAKGLLVSVEPISDGRELVVRDGLEVGDEIVAKGAGLLREGMQVR